MAAVLGLLAVVHEAIPSASVHSCLLHAGVGLTAAEVGQALRRLRESGRAECTDGAWRCSGSWREPTVRLGVAEGWFDALARAVKATLPVAKSWNHTARYRDREQAVREVRIAFYQQDARALQQVLWEMDSQFPPDGRAEPALVSICRHPFDPVWFSGLSPAIRSVAAGEVLTWSALHLEPCEELLELLAGGRFQVTAAVRVFEADVHILRGRLHAAAEALRGITGPPLQVRQGWMAFLRGDNEEALAHFESGLHDLRRAMSASDAFYRTYGGLFHLFALIKAGDGPRLQRFEELLPQAECESLWRPLCVILREVLARMRGESGSGRAALGRVPASSPASLALLEAVARGWLDRAAVDREGVRSLWRQAAAGGYAWAASEAGALLAALPGSRGEGGREAEEFRRRTGIDGLAGAVFLTEAWERALEALGALARMEAEGKAEQTARFVWFLDLPAREGDPIGIRPAEQRRSPRGTWTKGRAVPLRRLYTMAERPAGMTEQDHRICAAISAVADRWDPAKVEYRVRIDEALVEMVGHPHVFLADPAHRRVDLVQGNPELLIQEAGDSLRLRLDPPCPAERQVVLLRETPTRIRLIRLREMHHRVAAVLGDGLDVPIAARDRVREVVAPLTASLSVQSDIGSVEDGATPVAADPRIHVHLLPAGTGLTVEFLVQPFGDRGPTYVPCRGGSTVVADVEGRRLETQRDFLEERSQALAILGACPALAETPHSGWVWTLEDAEACLELLLQLQAVGPEARVEWPRGRSLSVTRPVDVADLHLDVRRQRDWFAISGNVRVDETLTVSLGELLRLAASATGRFIALDETRYVALTEEFRRRVDELATLGEVRRDALRCHPLAAVALQTLAEGAGGTVTDGAWEAHLERIGAAVSLDPQVPSTLRAELRDYQAEGYRWLCRLAVWGAGGCLADDMGLGKTVQALAVILARAGGGPSLVVAPTSVCLNWRDESARFTPTLNVRLFGKGDRQGFLDSLAPLDLVVCSYGLLQTEKALLSAVRWQTIVLDEAQAIKNPRAKRSQAAFRLQGDFRIVTTGTPIENNLEELWSLFRFLNPGLLGSVQSFGERFATPIERNDDPEARHRLRRLLGPFVLRRTKSQVLEELPARTEVTVHVQLSERERAFYEALRRQSLQRIGDVAGGPAARRMQILAEITRLRQACCHPQLILPSSDITSAKSEAFDEILDDLLANRHKALVFSQFVTHLSIVRRHLDGRGIRYQYLDGGTPQKDRAEAVAAFQRGEGDVFLISLRAGGTGLNLTAADYVVHLDPWWNPAVEDQASDRAHRIGQFRPVTIYRLVAADTIEDKIVALHHRKRELAESLLAGSEVPSAVSAEELLRLMAED
ncbi:MAG: DEAD/DEAH box helicase [Lentisphaeria bacterium]|nr:DEAD/DEAH box helicase [Lentisphaeria bacterium]